MYFFTFVLSQSLKWIVVVRFLIEQSYWSQDHKKRELRNFY